MKGESFDGQNNLEPEKVPEDATDMELALFLIGHMDNPCEVEVAPGVKENIREFYVKRAGEVITKMTNEYAKELLELKIKEYEKNNIFN